MAIVDDFSQVHEISGTVKQTAFRRFFKSLRSRCQGPAKVGAPCDDEPRSCKIHDNEHSSYTRVDSLPSWPTSWEEKDIDDSLYFHQDTPSAAPPLFLNKHYSAQHPQVKTGRLRLIAEDPSGSGYITRLPRRTLFNTTQDASDALLVRCSPASVPHGLELVNSGDQWSHLGVTWWGGVPNFEAPRDNNSTMTAIGGHDAASRTLSCSYQGPCQSDVWNVLPDGTVRVTWTTSEGVSFPLEAATFLSGRGIVFVPNYTSFVAHGRTGYSKARLIVEPVP